MKKLISLFMLAGMLLSLSVIGQDCNSYNDYKEGSSTKMVHYDKKDKPTGFTISTVKEKKQIAGGVSLLFHQEYSDYEDYSFESEFEIKCVNGDAFINMEKMLDPTTMTAYENMEFEVTADDLSIPSNASPGDVLDDGSVTIKINTGTPVKVSISVFLSNRHVESKEKIETPAGMFNCLKIKYNTLTQIGFIKVKSTTVEYYNKKHGVVRTESYNKKGKLTSYSVVEEIN